MHNRSGLSCQASQDVGIRTLETGLNLTRAAGADLEWGGISEEVRMRVIQVCVEHRHHLFHYRARILGVDIYQELCISSVCLFRRIRQQESQRPSADNRGHMSDAFVLQYVLFYLRHCASGFIDMAALRQPHINHELGSRRWRKERPVHKAESPARENQQAHYRADS